MQTLAVALTEGEQSAAVAGGLVGATLGVILACVIIFYVLTIIAGWKIFQKAGEPGWKALIPIYNIYIMYKLVNMRGWFWWVLLLQIIAIVTTCVSIPNYFSLTEAELNAINWGQYPAITITLNIAMIAAIWTNITYAWRTSKVFGHGVGYFFGILFLPNIFWLILGFGKSKYSKKALKK